MKHRPLPAAGKKAVAVENEEAAGAIPVAVHAIPVAVHAIPVADRVIPVAAHVILVAAHVILAADRVSLAAADATSTEDCYILKMINEIATIRTSPPGMGMGVVIPDGGLDE